MRVERYDLEERLSSDGVVEVWRARDSVDAEGFVELHLVVLNGSNAEVVEKLRQAARDRARRSVDCAVRVFEDLPGARFGVAYAKRKAPAPTLASADPPAPSRRGLGLALALVVLAGGLVLGGGWLLTRSDLNARSEEAGASQEKGAASAPGAPGCGDGALSVTGGCLDRAPVPEADFGACDACLAASPSIPAPSEIPSASRGELDACQALPRGAQGVARCATFDQAEAYCRSIGKTLPSLETWEEGRRGGMTLGADYEWTSTRWPGGTVMRRTGAKRGEPSQLHVALASPTVGFRCMRAL